LGVGFYWGERQKELFRAIASDSPVVRSAVVGTIAEELQEPDELFEILVKSLADVLILCVVRQLQL